MWFSVLKLSAKRNQWDFVWKTVIIFCLIINWCRCYSTRFASHAEMKKWCWLVERSYGTIEWNREGWTGNYGTVYLEPYGVFILQECKEMLFLLGCNGIYWLSLLYLEVAFNHYSKRFAREAEMEGQCWLLEKNEARIDEPKFRKSIIRIRLAQPGDQLAIIQQIGRLNGWANWLIGLNGQSTRLPILLINWSKWILNSE